MAKKKKMKDKRRLKIKKLKQAQKNKIITFICPNCEVKEDIPKEIVDTFDVLDDGDLLLPPRFKCEICGYDMEPIEYTSAHGITYRTEIES